MRSRGRGRLTRLAVVLVPAVMTLAGCGASSASLGAAPATTPSVAPSGTGPSVSITASPPITSDVAASPAPSPAGSGLVVDPKLLDVLPRTIDGVALEPDPTTAARIAGDASLATSAEAIAVALAIDPGSSSGDDLAIVSVVRLRPGVFSDAWFQAWRSTYDAAACDVAGGVQGAPSQATIGGRIAYIGSCAGNAHTYHVRLTDPARIVSITATGSRGFGELVLAGLAE